MSVNMRLIKDRMLDRVAKSAAHFKSQQQGEEDLSFDEKRKFAQDILERNINLFLQRFYKYLKLEDLQYFTPHTGSYEVNFYMEEIRKENDANKRALKIKNRRYEAMQRLIKEGKYFNDGSMRGRMPHLYEQMIGKYLTEEELKRTFQEEEEEEGGSIVNMSFSGFLLKAIDKEEEEKVKKNQEDAERAAEEETDSDESLEDEEEMNIDGSEDHDPFPDSKPKVLISDEEKEMLRHEFTTMMMEQFLSGKDKYDYRSVDDNADFDTHHICDMDEEEKYFDSEDPS